MAPFDASLAPGFGIEHLEPEHAASFIHHLRLHLADNGRDGLVYSPVDPRELNGSMVETQRRVQSWTRCMQRGVHQTEWRRVFVVRDLTLTPVQRRQRPDRGVVGHLDLRGGTMLAELHRCQLAMGLYRSCRGRGVGRCLLDAAVDWARQQPSLVWMDLGVFSHNAAALHLYGSAGFREVGRVAERYEVLGQRIDDVQMTLRLRPSD